MTISGQAQVQATPLQILGKIFGKYFKFLIDYGATDSFISNYLVKDMIKAPKFLTNGWQVEFGFGQKCYIKKYFRNIDIELSKGFIEWDLYVIPLASYDIILGMDWLMEHKALIHFLERWMEYIDLSKN